MLSTRFRDCARKITILQTENLSIVLKWTMSYWKLVLLNSWFSTSICIVLGNFHNSTSDPCEKIFFQKSLKLIRPLRRPFLSLLMKFPGEGIDIFWNYHHASFCMDIRAALRKCLPPGSNWQACFTHLLHYWHGHLQNAGVKFETEPASISRRICQKNSLLIVSNRL